MSDDQRELWILLIMTLVMIVNGRLQAGGLTPTSTAGCESSLYDQSTRNSLNWKGVGVSSMTAERAKSFSAHVPSVYACHCSKEAPTRAENMNPI